jgi:hypothetical protein
VKRFQVLASPSSQHPLVAGAVPVVRFKHSHRISAGTFANDGLKGPLENIDCSGALDLAFSRERAAGRVANVKSTSTPFDHCTIDFTSRGDTHFG